MKILILGGTSEASALSVRLRDRGDEVLLSYAGRTAHIVAPDVPYRVGGFGGADGLAQYLGAHAVDLLIDATHPFAARISANARTAAATTGIRFLRVERPAWVRQAGDRWIDVADMDAAARALGVSPRRVFLTIGRLEIAAFAAAPQHDYLVRAVDPFPAPKGLSRFKVIAARGPFALADELALLRAARIEFMVSKNSGGAAAAAKIEAARQLDLPLVMVTRPPALETPRAATVEEALQWVERHHDGRALPRGE